MKILSLLQYVSESFPVVIRQISLFVFGPAVLSCCHRNISFWNYSCREIAIFILSILLPYWMILFHYWYYMSFVAWTDVVIAFYQSYRLFCLSHMQCSDVCVFIMYHIISLLISIHSATLVHHHIIDCFCSNGVTLLIRLGGQKSMFLLLSFQLCLY